MIWTENTLKTNKWFEKLINHEKYRHYVWCKILTMQVQDVAILLWFNENRIYGLTREYRIEIGSLYSWPQESIFNDIARIVFILIVNKYTVYEPSNLRLRSTCVNRRNIDIKIRISVRISPT